MGSAASSLLLLLLLSLSLSLLLARGLLSSSYSLPAAPGLQHMPAQHHTIWQHIMPLRSVT